MKNILEHLAVFTVKLRVRLAWFLWRLILGRLAGRLPRNCVFSIEESLRAMGVAPHIVRREILRSEKVVSWPHGEKLPPWVRRTFVFGKQEMFLVRNVVIGPSSGVVWTGSGRVLAESVGSLNKILTFSKALPELCMPATNPLREPFESVIPAPRTNYFHWLLEVLPNVIQIFERQPNANILIHPDSPHYINESLALLLGGKAFEERKIESRKPIKIANCVFITMPQASGFVHPTDVLRVRHAILSRLGILKLRAGYRRIFISRRGTSARHVNDEAHIEARFAHEGYEIMRLEALPWKEQVRIFSEASCVAGLHGAGFSNLVFAPSDCRIHEIFPPGYTNDCYARLAAGLGLTYSLTIKNEDTIS